MPARPVIATVGFRRLARDFKLMAPDAAVAMRGVIRDSLEPIAATARRRAPVRTGRLSNSIRARAAGTRGSIRSQLPYARVHEFGGTVAPRGTPITISASRMVYGAIDEQKVATESRLICGMERMVRRHGFH